MGAMSTHRKVEKNTTLSSWAKEKTRLTGLEISILESKAKKIQGKPHLKTYETQADALNKETT